MGEVPANSLDEWTCKCLGCCDACPYSFFFSRASGERGSERISSEGMRIEQTSQGEGVRTHSRGLELGGL